MKNKSILFSLVVALAAFTFVSCGGGKKEKAQDHSAMSETEHASGSSATEAGEPQFAVDAAFQQQLANVFTSYVALKDAFVASDAAKVASEATTTSSALATTDMKLLTGVAHNDWMNYLGGMETSLKEIAASTDIEAQRQAFSTLSDNLYKSIKAYGLGGSTAYYEFCPMAFDNQGGYWLSAEEKIRNPYFGDKMLSCGTVKEKLK
jgi:hypothetical protein